MAAYQKLRPVRAEGQSDPGEAGCRRRAGIADANRSGLLQGATLGGMAINGNQLTLKARLRDGGMVFLRRRASPFRAKGRIRRLLCRTIWRFGRVVRFRSFHRRWSIR